MGELTEQEREILDFERRRWRYGSAKLDAIEATFAVAPVAYYQELSALLDRPEALAYAPQVVRLLRRQRASRQRARLTRQSGHM